MAGLLQQGKEDVSSLFSQQETPKRIDQPLDAGTARFVEEMEGNKNYYYKDEMGYWTSGVGHNEKTQDKFKNSKSWVDPDDGVSRVVAWDNKTNSPLKVGEDKIRRQYSEDLKVAYKDANKFFGDEFQQLPQEVQTVLISLSFNLGAPKLGIAVPQDQPPYRYVATGAVSYWNIEILDNFCQCIIDFYTDSQKFKILEEKWDWHLQGGMAGGICDMTILWHFAQEQEHKVITKVSKNNSTFDLNINTAINYYYSIDEYETKDGVKNIFFVDNKPYCKNIITNENILFHNLQFQGNSKHLVEKYVREIDINA